jgi:hypothetical protein
MLAAVATWQRGLLTRRQCLAAGMTDRAIRWRLDRGRWSLVHSAVYQTIPGRDDWHTGALAAQLAVPDSAWSYRTAAYVQGLVRARWRSATSAMSRRLTDCPVVVASGRHLAVVPTAQLRPCRLRACALRYELRTESC